MRETGVQTTYREKFAFRLTMAGRQSWLKIASLRHASALGLCNAIVHNVSVENDSRISADSVACILTGRVLESSAGLISEDL